MFHALGKVLYNKRQYKACAIQSVFFCSSSLLTGIGENPDGDPDAEARALAAERLYLRDNPLPQHLAHHGRPRYENDFEVGRARRLWLCQPDLHADCFCSPQELLSSAPLDTASFMLWVHQNMPQFCREIDETDQCLEAICDADRMKTDDDLVSGRVRHPQAGSLMTT